MFRLGGTARKNFSLGGIEELIEKLNEKSIIAVDTETSSINPQEADLVGVSVCYEPNKAFYIPVSYTHLTLPTNREV